MHNAPCFGNNAPPLLILGDDEYQLSSYKYNPFQTLGAAKQTGGCAVTAVSPAVCVATSRSCAADRVERALLQRLPTQQQESSHPVSCAPTASSYIQPHQVRGLLFFRGWRSLIPGARLPLITRRAAGLRSGGWWLHHSSSNI